MFPLRSPDVHAGQCIGRGELPTYYTLYAVVFGIIPRLSPCITHYRPVVENVEPLSNLDGRSG